MHTPLRKWLVVVAFLSCLAGAVAGKTEDPLKRTQPVPATEQIPIVDFFRPRLFRTPQLNDAGTMFAAMVTADRDREELLVYNFDTDTFEQLHGFGTQEIYDFDWLDDEHLMFSLASDKHYREGLYVTKARDLGAAYFVDKHNVSLVVARPETDRMKPVIWIKYSAYDEGKSGRVLQINAAVMTKDPFNTAAYIDPSSIDFGTIAYVVKPFPTPEPGIPMGYFSDLQGNLAYAYTADNGVDRLFRLADNQWVPCPVNLDDIDVVGSDRDGQLIVLGPRQEGKPRAIQYLDAATGQLGEVICQDEKYDPTGCTLYRHPVTKALLGIRYARSMRETLWFHPSYRVVQQAVEKFLPNQVVLILGSDKAEKRFFVAAYSDRQPTRYFSVDLGKRTLNLVKNPAPWIDPARMQPMNLLSYKSRDGRILEGYLTLPAGASKTHPAPLVVLPHGGPWVRDAFGFDSEVQFLASRGYAVFQPNYRGSLGTQWRFPESDMYEFRKMHDDVTDGVRRMLKSGLIDPDRVAIMGWSFGGYLALSGAVYDGGLYRCAVALSGVYDWEQVMKEAKFEEQVRGRYEFLRRHLGDPKTNQEKFDAISPLRHVANVKIPLFVGHGKADVIADIAQSKRLVSELKKYGVPVVTNFESGEGHGMAQMKNRVEMYEKIEQFLAANMAPRAQPAAPAAVKP